MNASEERLSESSCHYPHLYDESCRDYKDRTSLSSQIRRKWLGKQWDAARGKFWQPTHSFAAHRTSFGLCPAFVAKQKVMVGLVDVTCLTFMQNTRHVAIQNPLVSICGQTEIFTVTLLSCCSKKESHYNFVFLWLCNLLRFLDVSVQNRINNQGEYPAW